MCPVFLFFFLYFKGIVRDDQLISSELKGKDSAFSFLEGYLPKIIPSGLPVAPSEPGADLDLHKSKRGPCI